jgi:hypothetical protein
LLALAGALVGLLGVVETVLLNLMSDEEAEVLAADAGVSVEGYEQAMLAYMIVGFAFAGIASRVARLFAQRDAAAVMKRDPRDPVLLLRSFADDNLRLFAHRTSRQSVLERMRFRRRDRFEELLAWILRAYGPVIAVGEPGRRGRKLGAARETIDDPDWLTVVQARIQTSGHVSVVVGRTTGLVAEIAAIRERGLLERTLFVIPPLSAAEAADRWNHVASLLDVDGGLPVDDRGTILVRSTGERTTFYRGECRDDFTYETAIDMALAP